MSDQSRMGSFIEAMVNVVIGGSINFVANWLILPLLGFHTLSVASNCLITVIFTAISVVRSYILRRTFNGWLHATVTRYFPA